jgi:hypothetical protein
MKLIAMKKILLPLSLMSLSFLVACGSGSGGPAPAPPTGPFSTASLKGQYAYRLSGFLYGNTTIPYAEGGVFTADGNGNITSATDDLVQQGTALTSTSTSGTYTINADGTGSLSLTNASLGTINLAITLASTSKVYLIEQDAANTFGVAELQSSSTLATLPSGNFTFRLHDSTIASRAGQFSVGSGALTGTEDILVNGAFDNGTGIPLVITGSLLTPSNGRGTGSFNDGLSTIQFIYYVVDSNNIRILRTDSGIVSLGRAEARSSSSFSNTDFSGTYAFGSRADDGNSNGGINGQNTVGIITADGNGTITGGAYDSVVDGTSVANASITSGGTYTVFSDGSVVANFTTSTGATIQQIFWLVSSQRAFFLTNDSTKYEDGIADLQQLSTFSNSSLSGQYAFVMDGFIVGNANIDRVGWINGDGNGNLSWLEGVNSTGTYNVPGTLTGTYAVSANGRATATVNNLSQGNNDIIFYMSSASNAYILQNFSGYEIIGAMDLQ